MQALIAELRSIEASIESAREDFTEKSEALNVVQGRYYQIGAEISRTEQSIQHGRELRQRQRQDLEQAEQGAAEANLHLTRDQSQIDELKGELEQLEPGLSAARERERASAAALAQAEESMQDWQERWEEFNRDSRAASEKTQVERARIEQLEHQLHASGRAARAAAARAVAARRPRKSTRGSQALQAQQDEIRACRRARGESAARSRLRNCNSCASASVELVAAEDRSRQELQDAQGRLMSLQALQQAALGLAQGKVTEWLERELARRTSAPGAAAQRRAGLGACCRDGARLVPGSGLGRGHRCDRDPPRFVAGRRRELLLRRRQQCRRTVDCGRLLATVQGPAAISALLTGIIAVDTLPEALDEAPTLLSGESVITRDGVWIGREWLRVSRDKDVHAGVIGREKEMRGLRDVGRRRRAASATRMQAELADSRTKLAEHEQRRDTLQEEVNRLHRVAQRSRMRRSARCARRSEQTAERVRQHRRGDRGARARSPEPRRARSAKRVRGCRKASSRWRGSKTARVELEQEREELRQNLSFKRSQAQTDRDGAQEVAIKVESKRSALHVDFGGPRTAAPSARAAASSAATS